MSIRENAILVRFATTAWSARKYDKKVTDKITKEHGASQDAGRFNKCLIPADSISYKELTGHISAMRQKHYDYTLPWGDDAYYLLPVANDRQYRDMIDEGRRAFSNLLETFVADYPELKRRAQQFLNGMFKEEDYPSVRDIEARFSITVDYKPIEEANFRKVALASGLQDQLERQLEERVQRATENAMNAAWTRLFECVEKMYERLADPTATFRDTLASNLQECCDMLGRLNVTGDPQLERLRVESVRKLLMYRPDDIRSSQNRRANIAQSAADIVNQIRGTRRIITAKATPVAA